MDLRVHYLCKEIVDDDRGVILCRNDGSAEPRHLTCRGVHQNDFKSLEFFRSLEFRIANDLKTCCPWVSSFKTEKTEWGPFEFEAYCLIGLNLRSAEFCRIKTFEGDLCRSRLNDERPPLFAEMDRFGNIKADLWIVARVHVLESRESHGGGVGGGGVTRRVRFAVDSDDHDSL